MEIQEFINPKASLSPGFAGMLIMIISDTLWLIFSLPSKWSAIVLSFALSFVIFRQYVAPSVAKYAYIFFNGLIIFCIAVSLNYLGYKATSKSFHESEGVMFSTSFGNGFHAQATNSNGKIGLEIIEENSNRKRNFFDDWF